MHDSQPWIQMLASSKKEERAKAAVALGRLADPPSDAIAALVTATRDRSKVVRQNAAEALGLLGRGPVEVVAALVGLLHDKDENVSNHAVQALGRLTPKAKAAIQPLGDALRRWMRPGRIVSRKATIAALRKIGDSAREIAAALDDGEWRVRREAIHALGELQDVPQDIILCLIEKLEDSDTDAAAATALGNFPHAAEQIVPALIACWERSDFPSEEATESLIRLGTRHAAAIEAALRSRLLSVRLGAERVRLTWDAAANVPGELFASIDDSDLAIRAILAVECLPREAQLRAIPWLARVTAKPLVGDCASRVLGALGAAARPVRQSLVDALQSPLEYLRSSAAEALESIDRDADETMPAQDAHAEPIPWDGPGLFVQSMVADDQSQGSATTVEVETWEVVAHAIRRLDGKRYTSLLLHSRTADHMHLIGGAGDLDAVRTIALYSCSGRRGSRHFVLIDPQQAAHAEVQLNCEGTPTDTPLSATVCLEDAIQAAHAFCLKGGLDAGLTWSQG